MQYKFSPLRRFFVFSCHVNFYYNFYHTPVLQEYVNSISCPARPKAYFAVFCHVRIAVLGARKAPKAYFTVFCHVRIAVLGARKAPKAYFTVFCHVRIAVLGAKKLPRHILLFSVTLE